MGTDKNIKLHIVTDIKVDVNVKASLPNFSSTLLYSVSLLSGITTET